MVPFHNTLYQYHIHIRPDKHAVYVSSPGRSLKIILFQELPANIDDNRW